MTYFSVGTIMTTYLAKCKYDEEPKELPQFCYLRIAVGQFCSCPNSSIDDIIQTYHMYSTKKGTPASPTIFNMGFKEGSPSSCMIYTIEDSLDDILSIMKEAGIASKNNAGLGMDFSGLRHSNIGRHGVSQGIIPLLKIWDDLTRYINQGGRRPGALTCSTRIHHYDTPEFIHLVDKVGEDLTKATKINTSIMLSDLFRKRCEEQGKWNFFCPKQTKNLNLLHGKEFEALYCKYEVKAATWNRYKKYMLLKELKETTGLDIDNESLFEELNKEFNKPIPEECEEYQQYLEIKTRRASEKHLFEEKAIPKKILDQYQKIKEFRNLINIYHEEDILYESIKMFVELSKDVYQELEAIVNPVLTSEQLEVKDRWEKEEEFFMSMQEKYEGIPEQIDSREFDADSIMNEICDMQIKSGMPYIVHGCNTNRKNNMCNVGPVRSSNLCQEIMIPAVPKEQTGCCNLSSLALNSYVKEGKFDFVEFSECTRRFVVALNRVIDETRNVSDKVMKSNELNRPIGIGVNGFAEMCHSMNIPAVDISKLPKKIGIDEEGQDIYKFIDITQESPDYDPEALKERSLNPVLDDLNWKIWSCMYYNALRKSMELAKINGPYPNFWTSPTAKGKLQYHLWQDEAKETGRNYPFKLYPAEPSEWGDYDSPSWAMLIEDIMIYGLYNALLLTCMPTASSANVIGNCESTEFHMQNIYSRKVQSGDYPILNYHMVKDLQDINLWNEEIYNNIVRNGGSVLHIPESKLESSQVFQLRFLKEKYLTMWEIPQMIIIQLAAARQVFIDHSQSMNIYIAQPTKDLLKSIHNYTGEMGLKTGMYYLRSKAANKTMVIGKNQKAEMSSRKHISESKDTDMLKMIDLAIKSKEVQKLQEIDVRNEIIESTLMSAARPQEVVMCKFGADGECIGCGS